MVGEFLVRILSCYILLTFLVCCASVSPSHKNVETCLEGKIRFVTLVGSEVEHTACGSDLTVVVWKTAIRVCDKGKWKGTNLWTVWDGCAWKLVQEEGGGNISIVGRFKKLGDLESFLEIMLPMVRVSEDGK